MPVDDFYTAFSSFMRCPHDVHYQWCAIMSVVLLLASDITSVRGFFFVRRVDYFRENRCRSQTGILRALWMSVLVRLLENAFSDA